MKTKISLAVLLGMIGLLPTVNASEVKLKTSCLRAYPAAVGQTDPSLLGMYEQLCDKKNKDYQITYLIKAAQRFQQLDQNYQALQIVAELEKANVQSFTLTDVKLIASTAIANSALIQLKDVEKRRLTLSDTYSSVKEFTDLSAIASIQPLSLIKEKPVFRVIASPAKPKKALKSSNNTKNTKVTKKATAAPSKAKAVAAPAQSKSSTNPFASL